MKNNFLAICFAVKDENGEPAPVYSVASCTENIIL